MESSTSYNDYAEGFDRFSAKHYFRWPAQQLVSMVAFAPGEKLLDVGCGTGVVAQAALEQSKYGFIVATDLSQPMLRRARLRNISDIVVSKLPDLAFLPRIFDCVTAGFVLNHISDPHITLRSIANLLKPGGRVGLSSWAVAASDTDAGKKWNEVAERFVDRDFLARELERTLPSEQLLLSLDGFKDVVGQTDLVLESAEQKSFFVDLPLQDFLESRLAAMPSRIMKSVLTPETWQRFSRTVADTMLSSFGPDLNQELRVNFVIARVPANEK